MYKYLKYKTKYLNIKGGVLTPFDITIRYSSGDIFFEKNYTDIIFLENIINDIKKIHNIY